VNGRLSGGRLGPYLNGGTPDFRNLQLYMHPCEADDFIIVVSDGVHGKMKNQ
jgi:serine/threonine protein phosphatase PrpC